MEVGRKHPLYQAALSPVEIEQVRLLLSTFCDGSGATTRHVPWTVPDYRDFERVVATVCQGRAPENKGIFDVYIAGPNGKPYGISCKMAGPGSPYSPHTAFIEMTNSSKKFLDAFLSRGYDWTRQATEAGATAVDLVMSWHEEVGGEVDLAGSSYLLLTHSNDWRTYRLAGFPLNLKIADPWTEINWKVVRHRTTGRPNSLHGYLNHGGEDHRVWELYPESGGQLKYRPLLEWATWKSDWFELEQPPLRDLVQQARNYFPARWPD